MKSKPKSFYKLVNELENYFEKEGLTLIDKNVITKAIHKAVLNYFYNGIVIVIGIFEKRERFSVCFYYSDENNNFFPQSASKQGLGFSVCFYYSDENNKRKSAREGKFFEYTLGGIPVNDFTRLEKAFKFFIEILDLYEKEKQSENNILFIP